MTDELKPCPFCNEIDNSDIELYGRSRLRVYSSWVVDGHIYFVKCEACGARGPYFFTEKEAIAAWNARIESEDINRMRNLLEDVVNALDLSEIAIETHGPLGTEPAELVKLVLQQKDREIALLHHELDELPEWVKIEIEKIKAENNFESPDYEVIFLATLDIVLSLCKPKDNAL